MQNDTFNQEGIEKSSTLEPVSRRSVELHVDNKYTRIIAQNWATEPKLTLVILLHEFVSPIQQWNLYRQAEILLAHPSTPHMFVEGFEGKVSESQFSPIRNSDKRHRRAKIALTRESYTAGDVLAKFYPSTHHIHGADDNILSAEQVAIFTKIRSKFFPRSHVTFQQYQKGIKSRFDELVNPIQDFLINQLQNVRLQQLFLLEKINKSKSGTTLRALEQLAKIAGVDLHNFPSYHRWLDGLRIEKSLDFDIVEKERSALINLITNTSFDSLTEGSQGKCREWCEATQDIVSHLSPSIDNTVSAWLNEGDLISKLMKKFLLKRALTNISSSNDHKPEPSSSDKDLQNVPTESEDTPTLSRKVLSNLLSVSSAYRIGKISYTEFYKHIQTLCIALDISLQKFPTLSRYIDYIKIAEQIESAEMFSDEIPALLITIGNKFAESPKEKKILGLIQDLSTLRKFVCLSLPASKVVSITDETLSLTSLLHEIEALNMIYAITRSDALTAFAHSIDDSLGNLREYYHILILRSQTMIQKTLESVTSNQNFALLVCGRFHLNEILAVLKEEHRVSWVVIAPYNDIASASLIGGKSHQAWAWTWLLLDEEPCPPLHPTLERRKVNFSLDNLMSIFKFDSISAKILTLRRYYSKARENSGAIATNIKNNHPLERHEEYEVSSSTLHKFPGMPMLTASIKEELAQFDDNLKLTLRPDKTSRSRIDSNVYQVFLGPYNIGRFTIRRYEGRIERNFFSLLSSEHAVLVTLVGKSRIEGTGGTPFEDQLRIWLETLLVSYYRVTTSTKLLFRDLSEV